MKIQLEKMPRPYLSWSQYSLWKRDPRLYYRRYILNEAPEFTEALDFGKRLATALEKNEETGDLMIDQAMIFLPSVKTREHEIKVELDDIPIMGVLDGFDPDTYSIDEFKSGKTKWCQSMVDKHGQLTFYTLLVYLQYKKLPKYIRLHHWNTDPKSKWYGKFRTFETKRSMPELLDMGVDIKHCWEEIQQMVLDELGPNNGNNAN